MKICKSILFLCIISMSTKVSAQINREEVLTRDTVKINSQKNLFYGGVGTALLYFPAYIYYERQLQEGLFTSKFSSFVTVGTGTAAHWEGASQYLALRFGLLLGERKHRLETSFGTSYFYHGDMKDAIIPISFTVGYRSMMPFQRFVFRTGVGWPESLYVSWGVRF
jgi:hypothetical protein